MATLLIVDDDESVSNALTRLLAAVGHRVVSIPHGRAAVAYLKTKKIDLVLLDFMLPDLDGTEVLRAIRSDPNTATLPVVMYSAVSDPAFQKHALDLGANEYWVKASIGFDEIAAGVRRVLAEVGPSRD